MKVTPTDVSDAAKPRFLHRYLGAALTLLAVAIVGVAGVRWAKLLGSEPQAIATTSDTRAWALLGRALQASNQFSYSAHVETVVFVGARGLQSEARLWRAPDHLAIDYLSGPMKGQRSGFSNQMFWRRDASGQLESYAATDALPDAVARQRFELMRANYQAYLRAPSEIGGRSVEVIELRPTRPLRGVLGPARRVFVDDATGLMLRTERFNSRLQPVSHSTFSQLDLHPKTASAFGAPAAILATARQGFWQGEELGADARAVEQKTGIAPPQSARIPRGWKCDGFGVHRCVADNHTSHKDLQVAAFTRYTDGLNVLTLFALKNASKVQDSPASASYQCSFGPGTLLSRAEGAGTLLAIGDLPPEILRRVLEGARFKEVAIATPVPAPTAATPPAPGKP